jgi:SAM-dependent methyltransferase
MRYSGISYTRVITLLHFRLESALLNRGSIRRQYGKKNEIDYISQVAKIEDVSLEQFREYLANKPFSDVHCGEYLMDIAQIFNLLPCPPAKILDVGVGSGWTSELFAMRGYEVLGLDISPDMIDLANMRSVKAKFSVCDYETGPIPGGFDAAVIYDALHHAEDELSVLLNIYNALSDGGIIVTIEPGAGHSTTEDSLETMRKYGTTEKDMPFFHQKKLMQKAGFDLVEQYIRLSQLPVENIATLNGSLRQVRHGVTLGYGSATGLTSVVVARKTGNVLTGETSENSPNIADTLLPLSVAHDQFLQASGIRKD